MLNLRNKTNEQREKKQEANQETGSFFFFFFFFKKQVLNYTEQTEGCWRRGRRHGVTG